MLTAAHDPPPGGEIFISYARQDQAFVERLHAALADKGRRAWVDKHDIRPSAAWMEEVRTAIEGSDAFVFVISPDSAGSEVCREELSHAAGLNKRILPVLLREVNPERVPGPARARNWISFADGASFDVEVGALLGAIDTDPEWAHLHTRLQVRALEWDANGRDSSFVLRGRDLAAAEKWLTEADERKDPQPARLHTEYIIASRRAATRGQRLRLGILSAGLVVALLLAGFAFIQRNHAREEARVARSRELAALAQSALTTNPERSLVLGIQAGQTSATPEAGDAIRQALDASYVQRVLRGSGAAVNRAEFSPNGRLIVTASSDGTARVWDANSGKRLQTLNPHRGAIFGAGFSSDGRRVVTSTGKGFLEVWRTSTGALIYSRAVSNRRVQTAEFSPDGRLIVSAGFDGTARVWNAATGTPVSTFARHVKQVYSASFSPDGHLIVSAGGDGSARIWNARTGTQIRVLRARGGGDVSKQTIEVNTAAFSPDGRQVITGHQDGIARIWSAKTGKLQVVLPSSADELYSASFSPDGERVVTASLDGTARVYDPTTGTRRGVLVSLLRGHLGQVLSAAFSPDGREVVTASADRTARVWEAEKDDTVKIFRHAEPVVDGDFNPQGSEIVTAGHDDRGHIWDTRSGKQLEPLTGDTLEVWSAEFSPDGEVVATGSGDGTARLWDAHDGSLIRTLNAGPHGATVYGVAWSPNGRRLATASDDGYLRLWDVGNGRRLRTLRSPGGFLLSVDWSRDGRHLATGSSDGKAEIWTLPSGRLRLLKGHTDQVENAVFSPDGHRLVTTSDDKTARIWDVASGETLQVLTGHTALVWGAAFSPDGSRIATGSADHTIRIWDASSGHLLDVLRGFGDAVAGVAYAPDGQRILGTSYDDTARIMRCGLCVGFERLLEFARQRMNDVVSPAERRAYLSEARVS